MTLPNVLVSNLTFSIDHGCQYFQIRSIFISFKYVRVPVLCLRLCVHMHVCTSDILLQMCAVTFRMEGGVPGHSRQHIWFKFDRWQRSFIDHSDQPLPPKTDFVVTGCSLTYSFSPSQILDQLCWPIGSFVEECIGLRDARTQQILSCSK